MALMYMKFIGIKKLMQTHCVLQNSIIESILVRNFIRKVKSNVLFAENIDTLPTANSVGWCTNT